MMKSRFVTFDCPVHGMQEIRVISAFGREYYNECPKCPSERTWTTTQEDVMKEIAVQNFAARLIDSRLPRLYESKGFETFEATSPTHRDAIASLKALLKGSLRTVMLQGSTGVGKTHLLASTIIEAARMRMRAVYIRESDIINEVRNTFTSGGPLHIIQFYSYVPLLCLDEIDKTHDSEHNRRVMFDILDSRVANGRRTVIAGNISVNDVRNKFGDPLLSRFSQKGKYYQITGVDRRRDEQTSEQDPRNRAD